MRRTVPHTSATDATAMRAWGSSRLQLENPNSRAESPITHSDAGGLSTVMKFDESSEPKNHAFHDFVPACTAAA